MQDVSLVIEYFYINYKLISLKKSKYAPQSGFHAIL